MDKGSFFNRVLPIFVVGLVLVFLVFLLLKVISVVPTGYARYTNVIEAVVLGIILYIILRIIMRIVGSVLDRNMNKRYSRPLLFLISIVGYFIILLAILAIMGVDLSSVILGSAFAGAIVGLAAQQILSNFFSGILLIWSRPFSAGDYIEFNSWQYSYFLPSYPPKYLSRDEFRWKISGKVEDISLNFTTVIEEDGLVTKIPNSVVIQGIISANPHRKRIQIRLEIPKAKDFTSFKEGLGNIMKEFSEIDDYKVYVEEIAKDSYLVRINAESEGERAEYTRGKIMEMLLPLTR
ncbi:MAG: mechanosensitive ion channel family protein [Thermoplasmatales archaeon]